MGSELNVELLSINSIKQVKHDFARACVEVQRMIKDIDEGRLPQKGSKVELNMKLTFEADRNLDVDVTCQSAIKGPKYPADSVHALNRHGELKVVVVDQGELPGIRGGRVVRLHEEG